MNEHGFIRSIHRLLPPEVYHWKVNDNYAGGVPDCYYSASAGDCWIEYKYVPKLPKKDDSKVPVATSLQQRLWLGQRYREGRKVYVVVGAPEGCLLLQGQDMQLESVSRAYFISHAIDKRALVDFISDTTARITG